MTINANRPDDNGFRMVSSVETSSADLYLDHVSDNKSNVGSIK